EKDVGCACRCLIHPGTVETTAMRAVGAIHVKDWIDQRASVRFCGNAYVERNSFGRNGALLSPSLTSVERAIESDDVRAVIVPCDVEFAVRPDRRRSPDGASRS